jgi:uncharacterized Zn-binding protein involved in type VI secretion
MATGPDGCKTPAAPAPIVVGYPNIDQLIQALIALCCQKVKMNMMAPLTKDSIIIMSTGDEAGALGGVVSGLIKGPGTVKDGSTKVKCGGRPLASLGSMTAHNGSSANVPAGIILQCGQTKVMVLM